MKFILKRDWNMPDGSTDRTKVIPAGTHEIEVIPNPLGYEAPWCVLKGTQIGGTLSFWKQWENGCPTDPDHPNYSPPGDPNYGRSFDWGEFEVIIIMEETEQNLT